MDFDTAKTLMDKIQSASVIFADLSRDIHQLDELERTQLMHGLGHTMGEMYDQLIRPIARQHPSLDPGKEPDSAARAG